jgi:hypothetical protein
MYCMFVMLLQEGGRVPLSWLLSRALPSNREVGGGAQLGPVRMLPGAVRLLDGMRMIIIARPHTRMNE